MNILIVDDQPVNLKLLKATLEAEGHTVTQASDGIEALDVLAEHGADAIISDILMPRMDGYRLCSEVRKRKEFENLPFIHYTSTYTSPGDEKLSSELGADVFLRKPVPAEEIIRTLRSVTGRGHKVRATSAIADSDVMKEYSERLVDKLEKRSQQLQEAYAELRQLLGHSPAVIYKLKIDGQTITPVVVSDNIERLLGVSVAESTRYEWWLESLHPKDRERVLRTVAESLSKDGYSMEYRIRHKDGSYHWIEDNNRIIHDARGHATEAVGVWTDITERKCAEEAMKQSEHKYRHLFESLSEAAFLIDAKSRRILDVNLCAEKLLGRTRTEILGTSEAELFPLNRAADYCRKLSEPGTHREGLLDEAEVQSKDGTTVPVHVSVAPIELYGRDLKLALMADITERKRAEEAIGGLRRQSELILNSAGEGIYGLDLNGNINFINPKATQLLGWSVSDLLGKPAHTTLHHSHADGSEYPIESCPIYMSMHDGATRRLTNDAFWRKDGTSFRVDYVSAPIKDEHGHVRGCIVTFKDITEQFIAEARQKLQAEQYRLLFETNPNPMWVFDAKNLQILAVNDAAIKQYGYSREDFLKLTLTDLRPAEDAPDLLKSVTSPTSPAHFSGQFRHIRKDRSVILVDIYSGPIVWEGVAARIVSAIDITDRERASERIQAVLESALDCIITMDHQGRIVEFNRAAEETFGYSLEEAIGRPLAQLIIPPSLRERHERGLSRYLSTGEGPVLGKRIELMGMRRDKSEFPIELAITRIGSQEPPMFTGFIRDITMRKDAEKHLAQMEGRYRGLLEAAPDAMVVVNQGGEIVLLNLQAEKQFGYRRDELVGQKVKNIIPDGFAERLVADDLRSAEDALAQQIGTGIELTGRRKNGSDFPIEIMLSPLESAGGILVTAAIRDITERKQAEDRLRQQARLLDLAHDAIMVRDMEDRVEFWNHGAEELYGWTAAEVQGRKASAFLYQDEPASAAAARAAAIENGKWTGECKHKCKDGGTVMVRSRWSLVRDELAAPKSILIINTDVTEQKNLETHLLRAQRLESIGTLASGVAHDLNNVLTPILMCAEVLRANATDEDSETTGSLIYESARRGAAIIKQVLTFARGVEGERVLIKPSHLIEEIADIARKTFPKSIDVKARYPEDVWSVQADPTGLHQVLLNLAVNGRDAMPTGGALTFAAENFSVDERYAAMTPDAKVAPYVVLCVSDTGAGMSRATIDKIFDPFFTTKDVGKGTGLGLSTALGIMKSHGGFISVYSEIGKGTTFKLFLPATMSNEDLQKLETSVAPIYGNGEQLLVVDDEPSILQVTKMIFEKHNYRVLSAADGPEALALFAQQMHSIGGVLTDIAMPYMDGVALVRALKKMRPNVPIVASTGQGDQPGIAELQSLGVKNFLTKPYNTDKLLRTLHAAMESKPN